MSLVVFTGAGRPRDGAGPRPSGHRRLALLSHRGRRRAPSGALNMWYDADIDAMMSRTRGGRSPPGGSTREEALTFGLVLVRRLGDGPRPGHQRSRPALLAFTIFFYVVVYTMWLKRWTPQNIVIGGAAGACRRWSPGRRRRASVSLESLVLFAIIFMWTPPHFWALALFKSGTMSAPACRCCRSSPGRPRRAARSCSTRLALAPIGMLPWYLGFAHRPYALVSGLGGVGMLGLALAIWLRPHDDTAPAKRMFGFSILYLFALFATLLGEALVMAVVTAMADPSTRGDAHPASRRRRRRQRNIARRAVALRPARPALLRGDLRQGPRHRRAGALSDGQRPRPHRARRAAQTACVALSCGGLRAVHGRRLLSPPCRSTTCSARRRALPARPSVPMPAPGRDGRPRSSRSASIPTSTAIPWRFVPEAKSVTLRAGEVKTVYYRIINTDWNRDRGIASYNVTPRGAAPYFSKIQCFCFSEQTLGPGQQLELPVVFFVDPASSKDHDLDSISTDHLVLHLLSRPRSRRRPSPRPRRTAKKPKL